MTAATATPERLPTDYHESDDENGYLFGSPDPGPDGNSRYYGIAVTVRNPFEELGEDKATPETVKALEEQASAYKGGTIDDPSHLDPNGGYYCEEFAIECAVDYAEGEGNEAAYARLCRETDYPRCFRECAYLFTFRDAFAEKVGVDPSTLYPYNLGC